MLPSSLLNSKILMRKFCTFIVLLIFSIVGCFGQSKLSRDILEAKQKLTLNGDSRTAFQQIAVDASTPSGTFHEGDLWIKTGTDTVFAYDGSAWIFFAIRAANLVSPADAISPASDDGTGLVGVGTDYAREDHKHPAQQVSTDSEQLLKNGSDGLAMLDPDDLISTDAANSMAKGTDGKLRVYNLQTSDLSVNSLRTLNIANYSGGFRIRNTDITDNTFTFRSSFFFNPYYVGIDNREFTHFLHMEEGVNGLWLGFDQGNSMSRLQVENWPFTLDAPAIDLEAENSLSIKSDDLTGAYYVAEQTGNVAAHGDRAILDKGQIDDLIAAIDTDDSDADPTNEIQDLSLSGNTLSLTGDASPVDLSGYLDDTNTTNSAISVTGEETKSIVITDSEANQITTDFIDLTATALPNVQYLAPTALSTPDIFVPGTEIDAARDFAIIPRISVDKRNGIIYQCYRVDDSHIISADYQIVLRKSKDGGITWTGMDGTGSHSLYVPSIGTDRADPYILAVSPHSGRLFMFLWTVTSGGAFSANKFVYSDDEGVNWSAPATYNGGAMAGAPYGNDFSIGESGELLIIQKYNVGGVFSYRVLQSFDDGITWSERSTIITSSDLGKNMAEPIMRQGKNGLIVVVSRLVALNESGLNQPFICISQDYGRTWGNGTTPLTQSNLEDGDFNSGYLQLEGIGVNLGTTTNSHNCLPDVSILERNNKEYMLIPYYVRFQDAAYLNDYRMTVVSVDGWILQGQSAIDSLLPITFFQGASPSLNSADGNGFVVPFKDHEAIYLTADNQGTSSGGPAWAITARLRSGVIDSLIDEYELPYSLREKMSKTKASTFTPELFKVNLVDVSSGTIVLSAPTPLADGDWFSISDFTESAAETTNEIQIGFTAAGQTLFTSSQDFALTIAGGFAKFIWSAENSTWILTD